MSWMVNVTLIMVRHFVLTWGVCRKRSTGVHMLCYHAREQASPRCLFGDSYFRCFIDFVAL
ncbi:hypothetical protein M758_1G106900 [Ceratodon purpureus]|nr:hypothetical protein M758_1G106900 [Ceratodon purpureus]